MYQRHTAGTIWHSPCDTQHMLGCHSSAPAAAAVATTARAAGIRCRYRWQSADVAGMRSALFADMRSSLYNSDSVWKTQHTIPAIALHLHSSIQQHSKAQVGSQDGVQRTFNSPSNQRRRQLADVQQRRQHWAHLQQQQQQQWQQVGLPARQPAVMLQPPLPVQQQQRQPAAAGNMLPLPAAACLQHRGQQQQQLSPAICTLDNAKLTAEIKHCRTWHSAALLYVRQAQCMNHIHHAALLCQLAQLRCSHSSRPVNWCSFVRQVLAMSEAHLPACAPRQLASMVWALASMEYTEWTDQQSSWGLLWQQQLLVQLHSANIRDIANILWAVAKSSSASSSRGSMQPAPVQQQHHRLVAQAPLQQELLSALHRELPKSKPQVFIMC
eukprot:GHRR01019501.1.p1 GENE.GHRR01019501.1~~GHRR01019501.1.p1  ORF type:complete len:383 (+),score=153.71 GHRR01019501.1:251-1399(+)